MEKATELAATDLKEVRELERLESTRLINRLNTEEQERLARIARDMTRQSNTGPRLIAALGAQAEKMRGIIDGRIEIRKRLAQSFPALGSAKELDNLLEEINHSVNLFAAASLPRSSAAVELGPIKEAMNRERQRHAGSLSAHAKVEIEIIKREFALKLHTQQNPSRVVVNTAGGPAIINQGTIYGDVQQVINHLNGAGYRELADVLEQLAKAISDAEALVDDRPEYLEQVGFIARQAIEPAQSRQTSVVKGVLISLRARLAEMADIATILTVAGPIIAHHFSFHWPL